MATDDVAPRDRARLTRNGSPSRLARDLLRTEYGRRDRGRGGTGPADADGIWERLVAELRRLLRTFTGGSRSAPGGGGSGPAPGGGGPASGGGQGEGQETGPGAGRGDGQEAGQSGGRRPGPEGPVHAGLALLEQRVRRLPTPEREAFEDAVLDLVRNNRKYRKAFEKSPESMPLVARWATDAYERELAREAPPASVPSGQDPAGPRRDEPERSRGERPALNRAVPAVAPSVLDLPSRATSPFLSIPESPLTTPESPLTSRASPLPDPSDGLTPLPYAASPVSPLPYVAIPVSPLLSQSAPVSPLLSQSTPVSPLLGQAVPESPPLGSAAVASPISGDGHRLLSDSLDAVSRSSAPRGPGTSPRPGTLRPPPATRDTSAPPRRV
ncbi:hypothetical protein ACFVU0_20975 [Streptomyces sp. NPDC058122]|uniref:hypothetical protein n=1 Tax=Streptomyces sp. NPDC058122 TaxID=3346349 RepID=UPI0036E0AB22